MFAERSFLFNILPNLRRQLTRQEYPTWQNSPIFVNCWMSAGRWKPYHSPVRAITESRSFWRKNTGKFGDNQSLYEANLRPANNPKSQHQTNSRILREVILCCAIVGDDGEFREDKQKCGYDAWQVIGHSWRFSTKWFRMGKLGFREAHRSLDLVDTQKSDR